MSSTSLSAACRAPSCLPPTWSKRIENASGPRPAVAQNVAREGDDVVERARLRADAAARQLLPEALVQRAVDAADRELRDVLGRTPGSRHAQRRSSTVL